MRTVLEASLPMPYDVNARDGAGNTPLLLACANGSVNVLELLLEQEVDVDAQNSLTGNTPLHEACLLEDEEVRNWIGTLYMPCHYEEGLTCASHRANRRWGRPCSDQLCRRKAYRQGIRPSCKDAARRGAYCDA